MGGASPLDVIEYAVAEIERSGLYVAGKDSAPNSTPILLLDEATSSLDAESERAVQAALDDPMRDRTTLVIVHRLATAKQTSHIVAVGTHDELIASSVHYAQLAELQFGDRAA